MRFTYSLNNPGGDPIWVRVGRRASVFKVAFPVVFHRMNWYTDCGSTVTYAITEFCVRSRFMSTGQTYLGTCTIFGQMLGMVRLKSRSQSGAVKRRRSYFLFCLPFNGDQFGDQFNFCLGYLWLIDRVTI